MIGAPSIAAPGVPVVYCDGCGAELMLDADSLLERLDSGRKVYCGEGAWWCPVRDVGDERHHSGCVCLDCHAPDLPIADNN